MGKFGLNGFGEMKENPLDAGMRIPPPKNRRK